MNMRLTIEKGIFNHPLFLQFCIRVGSRFTAKGMIYELMELGQHYYTQHDRAPIPTDVYDSLGFHPAVFELLYAERRENGVYVRGAEQYFEWYFTWIEQKKEAGKRSAESRKAKKGTAIPENATNLPENPNDRRTTVERKPNESEPSFSSSSSDSISFKEIEEYIADAFQETQPAQLEIPNLGNSNSKPEKPKKPKKQKPPALTQAALETYAAEWQRKTGIVFQDSTQGAFRSMLKTLITRVGADNVCDFIRYYFSCQKYANVKWSLGILVKEWETIRTNWLCGATMATVKPFQTAAQKKQAEFERQMGSAAEAGVMIELNDCPKVVINEN